MKFTSGLVLGKWLLAVALLGSSSMLFAENPVRKENISKVHDSLYDYLTSTDFECSHTRRVLRPEGDGFAICPMTMDCKLKKGGDGSPYVWIELCRVGQDGFCEEPMDCARRELAVGGKGSRLSVFEADVSKTAEQGDCWEADGIKDKYTVLEFLNEKKIAVNNVCLVAYACKNKPTATFAACAPIKERGTDKLTCPQVNDCIKNDITFPGHTKKQFDGLTEAGKAQARREMEGKKQSLSDTVSSTLPRNSSTKASSNSSGHSK